MILCLTLNAAIDKTVIVGPFRLNEIHRPQQVLALPGGKGCNVARALKTLGETPVVSGWVGGFAGQFIAAGLQREGIQTTFIHTEAESRTCLSILDPENHTLTEIYEKGEPIPEEQLEQLKIHFRQIVGQYTAVTLSGSLPAGVPANFYADLIEIAHAAGVRPILDSSGAALKQGIAARPFLIKPNQKEFAELIGRDITDRTDLITAAVDVARQYQTIVVLSLGADGALATDGRDVFQAQPPPLTIVSAVGSGDCLLAGLLFGLVREQPLPEALRYGVAAGTANALRLGAGQFTREDFDAVHAKVTVASP